MEFFGPDLVQNLMIILMLAGLEGLLGADNALVLAIMVKHLPEHEQKKALKYGIWGAFAFRLIAILMATWLVKFWYVKAIGAAYLMFLTIQHFSKQIQDEEEEAMTTIAKSFWATVAAVEMMDIAFSVDSILACLAFSDKVWVLYAGGVLGIIMMRFVAGYFITLLKKYPSLNHTAYILIGMIAVKMMLSIPFFEIHIPTVPFMLSLVAVFIGTIVYDHNKKVATTA